MLRVKVNQLQEGCILSEDVVARSGQPIIPKNTVLTPFLLTILDRFLVEDVYIEPMLSNGKQFEPSDLIEKNDNRGKETKRISQYLKAVEQYKRLFQAWQAGLAVDIGEIRKIVIPLIDIFVESKRDLFALYRYTTKEDYIYHHAVSVGVLSGFLAKNLNYQKGDYYQIALAGILSNCGMAKVDTKLLSKISALTYKEYEEIKHHTIHGYKMVQKISALQEGTKLAVLQHHERNDGSGYPFGIDGKKIHPYSKIVAVADVYHALTSERPYRGKQSPFKALEQLQADCFGKLNIEIVKILVDHLTAFNIGTKVRLSNGELAEIVFVHPDSPTRPMVKNLTTDEFISLKENRDVYIEEVIDLA